MANITTLEDELARVECKGKLRRWRRPVSKNSNYYHYFWKCPCGAGMRYANHNAMYDGSLKHKKGCEDASPPVSTT